MTSFMDSPFQIFLARQAKNKSLSLLPFSGRKTLNPRKLEGKSNDAEKISSLGGYVQQFCTIMPNFPAKPPTHNSKSSVWRAIRGFYLFQCMTLHFLLADVKSNTLVLCVCFVLNFGRFLRLIDYLGLLFLGHKQVNETTCKKT